MRKIQSEYKLIKSLVAKEVANSVNTAKQSPSTIINTLSITGASAYGTGNSTSTSTGTVTSVALTLPGIFTVTGSPITTSGTIAATLASQSGNLVFASPNGSSGTPAFRALVNSDLPTSGVTAGSYTNANLTVDVYGRITTVSNGSSGSPGGSDTQVQYNNAGAFAGSSLFTFNSTTGFLSTTGLRLNPAFDQVRNYVDGGVMVRQATVFSAFRTAASGTATGPDTGGYTDITSSVNNGVFNVFNGTAALSRIYLGWDGALPRELRAYSNSGTLGVTGVVLWERWDGAAWVTITGTNLTADGTSVTIPTTATSKTTINSVSAYWIRATVSTAYTVAPVFRFIRSSTASNISATGNPANYLNGIFIAPSSTTQSILNTVLGGGSGGTALITAITYGNGEQNIMQVFSSLGGASLFSIGGDGTISAGNADNTFRNLTLNGGASNQNSVLTLTNGSKSQTSWLTSGAFFRSLAGTRTNSSAAATYATAVFNSFNIPTLAATNAGTVTTAAANVYIEGAVVQGTNQTLTNTYALWVDAGKTRIDGELECQSRTIGLPVTLTDAANIALNASLGNQFRVTLGGNRTLDPPTNAVDGQRILIEVIQDGTGSRTLTLTTGSSGSFAFGTDITGITLTTTAGATDYIGCVYNSTAQRWRVIAFVKGY